MVWLPDGKKNFEDIFSRFDRIHKRDRQTDGRTPYDGIGRACIASRGKNGLFCGLDGGLVMSYHYSLDWYRRV